MTTCYLKVWNPSKKSATGVPVRVVLRNTCPELFSSQDFPGGLYVKDSNGNVKPVWVEYYNANISLVIFWFPADLPGDEGPTVYELGVDSSIAVHDPEQVFPFFDGFDSDPCTSGRWKCHNNGVTISASNSVLTLGGDWDGTGSYLNGKPVQIPSWASRIMVMVSGYPGSSGKLILGFTATGDEAYNGTSEAKAYLGVPGGKYDSITLSYVNGSGGTGSVQGGKPAPLQSNSLMVVEYDGSKVYGGAYASWLELDYSYPAGQASLVLAGDTGDNNITVSIDWALMFFAPGTPPVVEVVRAPGGSVESLLEVTVSNSSGSDYFDVPVKVVIDSSFSTFWSKVSSADNIVVSDDPSFSTVKHFYVDMFDSTNKKAVIYFKASVLANSTRKYYIGYVSSGGNFAVSPWEVFLFYEDWNTGTFDDRSYISARWNIGGSATFIKVENGNLEFGLNGGNSSVTNILEYVLAGRRKQYYDKLVSIVRGHVSYSSGEAKPRWPHLIIVEDKQPIFRNGDYQYWNGSGWTTCGSSNLESSNNVTAEGHLSPGSITYYEDGNKMCSKTDTVATHNPYYPITIGPAAWSPANWTVYENQRILYEDAGYTVTISTTTEAYRNPGVVNGSLEAVSTSLLKEANAGSLTGALTGTVTVTSTTTTTGVGGVTSGLTATSKNTLSKEQIGSVTSSLAASTAVQTTLTTTGAGAVSSSASATVSTTTTTSFSGVGSVSGSMTASGTALAQTVKLGTGSIGSSLAGTVTTTGVIAGKLAVGRATPALASTATTTGVSVGIYETGAITGSFSSIAATTGVERSASVGSISWSATFSSAYTGKAKTGHGFVLSSMDVVAFSPEAVFKLDVTGRANIKSLVFTGTEFTATVTVPERALEGLEFGPATRIAVLAGGNSLIGVGVIEEYGRHGGLYTLKIRDIVSLFATTPVRLEVVNGDLVGAIVSLLSKVFTGVEVVGSGSLNVERYIYEGSLAGLLVDVFNGFGVTRWYEYDSGLVRLVVGFNSKTLNDYSKHIVGRAVNYKKTCTRYVVSGEPFGQYVREVFNVSFDGTNWTVKRVAVCLGDNYSGPDSPNCTPVNEDARIVETGTDSDGKHYADVELTYYTEELTGTDSGDVPNCTEISAYDYSYATGEDKRWNYKAAKLVRLTASGSATCSNPLVVSYRISNIVRLHATDDRGERYCSVEYGTIPTISSADSYFADPYKSRSQPEYRVVAKVPLSLIVSTGVSPASLIGATHPPVDVYGVTVDSLRLSSVKYEHGLLVLEFSSLGSPPGDSAVRTMLALGLRGRGRLQPI